MGLCDACGDFPEAGPVFEACAVENAAGVFCDPAVAGDFVEDVEVAAVLKGKPFGVIPFCDLSDRQCIGEVDDGPEALGRVFSRVDGA